jgi:hypothetical protein
VLSDYVSAGLSEWGCILSVRAFAEGGGEFVAGWVFAEDFCGGEKEIWGYSALPGDLLLVRERALSLLRE